VAVLESITNKRHAAFVARVVDGESYVDAWVGAGRDTGANAGGSVQSNRVMGSRLAKRYADEIAHAKKALADDSADSEITVANLNDLMDTVSSSIKAGIEICEKLGEKNLSTRLRITLVQHCGRVERTEFRAGPSHDEQPPWDSGAMLGRLTLKGVCNCGQ